MKISTIPIDGYTQVSSASLWIDGVLQNPLNIYAANTETGEILMGRWIDGKRVVQGDDFARDWQQTDKPITIDVIEN